MIIFLYSEQSISDVLEQKPGDSRNFCKWRAVQFVPKGIYHVQTVEMATQTMTHLHNYNFIVD